MYLVSVSTLDEARGMIDRQSEYWISDCACRLNAGGKCGNGMRVCLAFAPEHASSTSHLAKADKDEVLRLLEFAGTSGLVPRPHNTESGKPAAICFCCECCCCYHNKEEDRKKDKAGLSAVTLDKTACVNCGACAKVCHFGALRMENGKLSLNAEKCFGCGLCVLKCRRNAVTMASRQIKGS